MALKIQPTHKMISPDQIEEYLNTFSEQYPQVIAARLKRGDIVGKSMGLTYEIDDPEIDRRLGQFSDGIIPYGPTYRALRSSPQEIRKLFGSSWKIPFSRVVEAGLGECLEIAVLTQLAAQRGSETAYLINGALTEDDDPVAGPHAFNVVVRKTKPFLVDVQNPLAKDSTDKITHPYLAPLLGISNEGDFIVPPEWKQGRMYSIS